MIVCVFCACLYWGGDGNPGALKRAGVGADLVEMCYMGNVFSAGIGQAPARQAALKAGLDVSCVCTTVNKVCASGMKSIMMGVQDIELGIADVVVAGGMENMSQVPYYIEKARFGYRMGNGELKDGMMYDGLIDAGKGVHMGVYAEECARRYGISREQQDAYARESYEKSRKAWKEGWFEDEVEKVEIKVRGKKVCVEKDEGCDREDIQSLDHLRTVFLRKEEGGTVTRGNASGLNDGAAAVVLVSREKGMELGLNLLGRICGYADAETRPEEFTTAPTLAVPKAMKRAKMKMEEVDVMEVNEAFSVVAVANMQLMKVDRDKLNIWGGAVSLGHPLGCSGARIVVTLMSVMRWKKGKTGVAGVCNGGGGASAVVVKMEDDQRESDDVNGCLRSKI